MPIANAVRRAQRAEAKKNNELSVKEKIVVSQLLTGKTAREALTVAGYSSSVGEKCPSEVTSRPRVQAAMAAALEARGLTTAFLANHAAEGLAATRRQYHEGSVIDETPDFGNRHKYFNTVLELAGHLKRQQDQDSEDGWEGMLLAVRRRQGGNQGDRGQLEE